MGAALVQYGALGAAVYFAVKRRWLLAAVSVGVSLFASGSTGLKISNPLHTPMPAPGDRGTVVP